MAATDPFDLLGVDVDIDAAGLKSAYRRAAMACHPDHCREPDADARFEAVKEAYDTLSNPARRDQARRRRSPFAGLPSFDQALGEAMASADAHGFRHHPPRPAPGKRGPDVLRTLRVTLEQAYAGGEHALVNPPRRCTFCAGEGRFPTKDLRPCPDCDGTGRRACLTCSSTGGARVSNCGFCKGLGMLAGAEHHVRIPRGATDGSVIRVRGKGATGDGDLAPGDLVVTLAIDPHHVFERRGNDLHATVAVDGATLREGGAAALAGLDGSPVPISVPPGSGGGDRVTVRGRGMPGATGMRGDVVGTLAHA